MPHRAGQVGATATPEKPFSAVAHPVRRGGSRGARWHRMRSGPSNGLMEKVQKKCGWDPNLVRGGQGSPQRMGPPGKQTARERRGIENKTDPIHARPVGVYPRTRSGRWVVGRRGRCSTRHNVASPQSYSRASSDDLLRKLTNWHCDGPMNIGVSVGGNSTSTWTLDYTVDDPSGSFPNPTLGSSGVTV
jgi:hypothetical protein